MNTGWLRRGFLGLSLVLVPIAAQAAKKKSSTTISGVLNLNRATPEQLKMLPGVKEKAVVAIVAHRQQHPFTRVEELVNVQGFNKARFDKLKPYLAVNGETTLKVQKAHPAKGRSGKRQRNHQK